MKLKINAELTGQELVAHFDSLLKTNNIEVKTSDDIKFIVTNSQGKEVEVVADKIRLSYIKE